MLFWQIEAICEKYGVSLKTPIKDLPEEALNDILNGTDERLNVKNLSLGNSNYFLTFDGLIKYIEMQQQSDATAKAQKWAGQFVTTVSCPECGGARLNKEALHYRIDGKNIAELTGMDIAELYQWLDGIEDRLPEKQAAIAREILKEIRSRLQFLIDVGLEYLSLSRASSTLSVGESQRIRLATQIGSQLVNVLYILDEPSIGLHQRDNIRLIHSLKQLRDMGNSVVVVEHDKDMMLEADYIVAHFAILYPEPIPGAEVYIYGKFADWQLLPELKMDYDAKNKAYVGQAELKQGYYDYMFAVVPSKEKKPD